MYMGAIRVTPNGRSRARLQSTVADDGPQGRGRAATGGSAGRNLLRSCARFALARSPGPSPRVRAIPTSAVKLLRLLALASPRVQRTASSTRKSPHSHRSSPQNEWTRDLTRGATHHPAAAGFAEGGDAPMSRRKPVILGCLIVAIVGLSAAAVGIVLFVRRLPDIAAQIPRVPTLGTLSFPPDRSL